MSVISGVGRGLTNPPSGCLVVFKFQTMVISLHGHAFRSNSDPDFDFSALNGMRNITNGH